jgi:hypothetical protein
MKVKINPPYPIQHPFCYEGKLQCSNLAGNQVVRKSGANLYCPTPNWNIKIAVPLILYTASLVNPLHFTKTHLSTTHLSTSFSQQDFSHTPYCITLWDMSSKLCALCQTVISTTPDELHDHHPDAKSLSKSAEAGCPLCIWKYSPVFVDEKQQYLLRNISSICILKFDPISWSDFS